MKAGAAGGIEAVVKAISTHISNAGVYISGCGALLSMTINNGKNKKQQMKQMKIKWTAENQMKVREIGGIEAVVKAINTHIDNHKVCHAGCSALKCLTDDNGKSTEKVKQNENKMNS